MALHVSATSVQNDFRFYLYVGLFEKWSTLDPKNFYAIPFQKLVFLISLYPEFLEKNQRNKKKLIFGQFSLFLFPLPC